MRSVSLCKRCIHLPPPLLCAIIRGGALRPQKGCAICAVEKIFVTHAPILQCSLRRNAPLVFLPRSYFAKRFAAERCAHKNGCAIRARAPRGFDFVRKENSVWHPREMQSKSGVLKNYSRPLKRG